ncbi:hypothetical protein C8R43DRAFT_194543 [Mycena crocata]|nr:hypothetical protein C8R43DRAFT_194543 [Mycena crocata]
MPATPSSPSSPSSTPSKAPPSPAIPIAITAIAILLLSSIMLLTFHFRRQNKKNIDSVAVRKGREVQEGEVVSRTHPAALMITPAEGKGTPRFVHTPGTNMRIATRRSDGAWEFADPRAPFMPAIIADATDDPRPLSRNSSAAMVEHSSDPRNFPPSHSPYSHASYGYETPGGSPSELLPLPTAASASPWGAPTTPRTADSGAPSRPVHSSTPSTPGSAFLPAPSISDTSRRSSAVSSNNSYLDLEPSDSTSTYTNPFQSPAPSVAPSRNARWPASPLRTPASLSPEPPTTPITPAARAKEAESRAAREIRRGYEDVDRNSAYAEQSSHLRPPPTSPEPPMTPAALAKETESRAARAIRRGYESVDRHSEYAEQDEGLPAY